MPRRRAPAATSIGKTPLPAISPSLLTLAADNSALGIRDEVDEAANLGKAALLVEDLFERILTQKLGIKDSAHRALEGVDRFGRKAAALKPDLVDADQAGTLGSGDHPVGRHVLPAFRTRADDRVGADPAELMYPGHPFYRREFFDDAMSA